MRCRIAAIAVTLATFVAAPGVVRAEHPHGYAMADAGATQIAASIALEAASYDSGDYVGSYQAVMPQLAWTRGRFGASAAIGLYRLDKNGRDESGLGDAMATGHATLARWQPEDLGVVQAGAALHVMVPTGSETAGLGMGHWMIMPSAWAAWQRAAWTATASAGYARAAISLDGAHHDHGPRPLVDPMNLQELTWSAGVERALGGGLAVAARTLGGAPIGHGRTRVIGGARVGWGGAHMSTGVELQLGLAGDPFSVRGVVDAALRF